MEDLVKGGSQFAVSANAEKILFKSGPMAGCIYCQTWVWTGEGGVSMTLRMELNRLKSGHRYSVKHGDTSAIIFMDRNMHGRDWKEVWDQYAPLMPFIRHRADLTYMLDQLGGEVSVGHSFVFGGDFSALDTSREVCWVLTLSLPMAFGRSTGFILLESWNPRVDSAIVTTKSQDRAGQLYPCRQW